MAWIYLAESEASVWPFNHGLEQSPIVKTTDMHKPFSCPECKDENSKCPPSGMTLEQSQGKCCLKSILFREVSPARTSALLEMESAWKESEADYFLKSSDLLASFDQDSFSWKTSQLSLFGGLSEFAWSSLRSGMIVDGQLYQPAQLEPVTEGIDGGFLPTPTASEYGTNQSESSGSVVRPSLSTMARKNLWPTPRANDSEKRGDFDKHNPRNGLPAAVKKWPTPKASDWKRSAMSPSELNRNSPSLGAVLSQSVQTTGQLNPVWVEWLMGYRLGHTELDASVTQWFRSKQGQRL